MRNVALQFMGLSSTPMSILLGFCASLIGVQEKRSKSMKRKKIIYTNNKNITPFGCGLFVFIIA